MGLPREGADGQSDDPNSCGVVPPFGCSPPCLSRARVVTGSADGPVVITQHKLAESGHNQRDEAGPSLPSQLHKDWTNILARLIFFKRLVS